ncbi:MAG: pilus assembly protein PilM [Planctomycetota bacterium]
MLGSQSYWGIDVGATSVKLVRLKKVGTDLTLVECDVHSLGDDFDRLDPDGQRKRLAETLRGIADAHGLGPAHHLTAAIPGQSAFPQIVSIPPVHEDKVGELARYEASHRVPYLPEEVVLGYEKLPGETVNETRLFVLSLRKDIVQWYLEAFREAGLSVDALQVAPLALYNYLDFDQKIYVPTVLLDIGRTTTDIVLTTEDRHWFRTLPFGGDQFTKALAAAAHSDFEKAERRKTGDKISAEDMTRVLRPQLERLREEIEKAAAFGLPGFSMSQFGRVWLHGGSADLAGLEDFIRAAFPHAKVQRLAALRRLHINKSAYTRELHDHLGRIGAALGAAIQGAGRATNPLQLLPHRASRPAAGVLFVEIACALLLVLLVFTSSWLVESEAEALESGTAAATADLEDTAALAEESRSEWRDLIRSRSELAILGSVTSNQTRMVSRLGELLEAMKPFGERGLSVRLLESRGGLDGPSSGELELTVPLPGEDSPAKLLEEVTSALQSIVGESLVVERLKAKDTESALAYRLKWRSGEGS